MITKRLIAVAIVLLVGLSTVFLLPKSTATSPAGIAMVLPNYVGDWIGQDSEVTQRERDVLAKDTEFARKTYTNLAGDSVYVSIVLSGDDMTNSIHRPARCLPAQGWNLQASSSLVLPLAGGRQLELTRLRTARSMQRKDETQGTLQPIRRLYVLSVSRGERDAQVNVTSWALRCATDPLKLSVANVHPGHPSGVFGPCMK